MSPVKALPMIALLLLLGGCSSDSDSGESDATGTGSDASAQEVTHTKDSLETVRQRVESDEAVLIDVREPSEWNNGHLQVATLVPLSELTDKGGDAESLQQLSKDKILYCHCKSGGRAIQATEILRELGYDCRPLKAGYDDLVDFGFDKAAD